MLLFCGDTKFLDERGHLHTKSPCSAFRVSLDAGALVPPVCSIVGMRSYSVRLVSLFLQKKNLVAILYTLHLSTRCACVTTFRASIPTCI